MSDEIKIDREIAEYYCSDICTRNHHNNNCGTCTWNKIHSASQLKRKHGMSTGEAIDRVLKLEDKTIKRRLFLLDQDRFRVNLRGKLNDEE